MPEAEDKALKAKRIESLNQTGVIQLQQQELLLKMHQHRV